MKPLLQLVITALAIVLISADRASAATEEDASIGSMLAASMSSAAFGNFDSNVDNHANAVAVYNGIAATLTAQQQNSLLFQLNAMSTALMDMVTIQQDGDALLLLGDDAYDAEDWDLAVEKFSAAFIKYDESWGPNQTFLGAYTDFDITLMLIMNP